MADKPEKEQTSQVPQEPAEPPQPASSMLLEYFLDNSDKRILVVGTLCSGKRTFVEQIAGVAHMDFLLHPLLSDQEYQQVTQEPWTEQIGELTHQLANQRVKIEAGTPVFGNVVVDCDIVILLKISDETLRKRLALIDVPSIRAKKMQSFIMDKIRELGKPMLAFNVG